MWKSGDCFDFAIVLASFLLGAGYDALVVVGYAPAAIRLADQSDAICPMLDTARTDAVRLGGLKDHALDASAAKVNIQDGTYCNVVQLRSSLMQLSL